LAKRVGQRGSNPSSERVWSGLVWRSRMLGHPIRYQIVKEPTIGGAEKHRWSSIICSGGLRVLNGLVDRSGSYNRQEVYILLGRVTHKILHYFFTFFHSEGNLRSRMMFITPERKFFHFWSKKLFSGHTQNFSLDFFHSTCTCSPHNHRSLPALLLETTTNVS